jgi:hypothetical protein
MNIISIGELMARDDAASIPCLTRARSSGTCATTAKQQAIREAAENVSAQVKGLWLVTVVSL